MCKYSPDAGQAVEVKVSALSYCLCHSVLLGSHLLPQQGWWRLGQLSHPAHHLSLRIRTGCRVPNRRSASDKSFPSCFLVPSSASTFLSVFPVAIPLDQFLHHQHYSVLQDFFSPSCFRTKWNNSWHSWKLLSEAHWALITGSSWIGTETWAFECWSTCGGNFSLPLQNRKAALGWAPGTMRERGASSPTAKQQSQNI